MAKQVLNKSTPSNRVDHVDQRKKINDNFTELYEGANLKTVNGESIVGTGDLEVTADIPDATLETAGKVKVRGYSGTGAPIVLSVEGSDNAYVAKEAGKSLVTDAEKSNWNGASIGSDLGLLKTTDTPPPTGTHKGDVNSAGTYTNFKTAAAVSIVFTAPELVDNFGYIYVVDNVATKSLVAKKGGVDLVDNLTEGGTTKALTAQQGKLLSERVGFLPISIGEVETLIPLATNTSTSASLKSYYYTDQSTLRGRRLVKLLIECFSPGTFSILIGKNVNTPSYTFVVLKVANLNIGINEIDIDVVLLSNESIGINDVSDTAKFRFNAVSARSIYVYDQTTSTFSNATINSYGIVAEIEGTAVYQTFSSAIEELRSKENYTYFLERPANGIVNFQVPVDCSIPDTTSQTLENQHTPNVHLDWGILLLPSNYNKNGKPIKLVIACHGTGTWIDGTATETTHSAELLSQGYAVLDMNGIPSSFVSGDSTKRHYGAPFTLESYVKGYQYATEKYNIRKDGSFVYGISMGGLSSFMLTLSGAIPIIAQGAFCPCIDLYKQAFVNPWDNSIQREQISQYFGFSGTPPTFTSSKPPSAPEIAYFMANKKKWLGYNSMTKNVNNLNLATMYDYLPVGSEVEDATEEANYIGFNKLHPVPLKIWHNKDDATVKWRYSKYFVEMVNNSGGLAYLRSFPSGGHNAWLNGNNVTGIETVYGTNITMKSSIYELIMWFKKFNKQ